MESQRISLLSNDTNSKQGFSKRPLALLVSVVLIIAAFIGYNNGFISNSNTKSIRNKQTHGRLEQELFDYKSFTIKPELESYDGINVELIEDPGDLSLQTFTTGLIVGKFNLNNKPQTLEFIIDAYSKYISLQLIDNDSNDVINSFYTKKTLQKNAPDYYTIDGVEIDPSDEESFKSSLLSFYASDIPVSLAHLSTKIASKGYSGKVAKSIGMLHSMSVHLIQVPEISPNVPSSIKLNTDILNKHYQERERRRVLEANDDQDDNEDKNNDDNDEENDSSESNCLFGIFCNGNKNCDTFREHRECPTDCYANGGCTTQEVCGNECAGVCGVNCDCVWFICGNCDCHCLCYNHDYYCSCEGWWSYGCAGLWEWLNKSCD